MNYTTILFFTVFLIYVLKAFRFYFLLVGENIPVVKYLRVFAITTFVNIFVPFKAGEVFRFLRFGHLTKKYLKGLAIVLLDRFIDTISLITIFAAMHAFVGTRLDEFFFLLVFVCVFLAVCFFMLPGMMDFWNLYFIESRSSVRHLRALDLIKKISGIYVELKNLVRGRFFVLFTLSLLSWGIELCSLYFCRRYFDASADSLMADYLSSALTGKEFAPQKNFALFNMFFLAVVYVFMLFVQLIRKVVCKNGR